MRGLAAGLVLACFIAACAARQQPLPDWQKRQTKMNQVTTLWAQIRDWRREAGLKVEPSEASMLQWRGRTVVEAARVCPDGHSVPKTCDDVCSLADAICDNAEAICEIAKELGKDDQQAQEKCASATASCREAKQRCCGCSEEPAR
ncbi:MAG: hypothetical protein H0T89_04420 [Deltaproteobacteria bacterium]|nr:hypothetical protein [Deltaproteobacteria bacterium]MDQ3301369.1 hypothetical protein [Myxococcota bacterium]